MRRTLLHAPPPVSLLLAAWGVLAAGATAGCRSKPPRVEPRVLAPPLTVPASPRTSLALTSCSRDTGDGYAFVREQRRVPLPAGRFVLRDFDIASDVVPETGRFELVSTDGDGTRQAAGELVEQQHLTDRLSPKRPLEKSEGERVTAVGRDGARIGQERSLISTVVSTQKGVMVRPDSGKVTPIGGEIVTRRERAPRGQGQWSREESR